MLIWVTPYLLLECVIAYQMLVSVVAYHICDVPAL